MCKGLQNVPISKTYITIPLRKLMSPSQLHFHQGQFKWCCKTEASDTSSCRSDQVDIPHAEQHKGNVGVGTFICGHPGRKVTETFDMYPENSHEARTVVMLKGG